jgi:nitroimidazol reductase NimA-like FMN-containing flavoprotein (pyridoxamine 5'-phosphate oxidase superfamily)
MVAWWDGYAWPLMSLDDSAPARPRSEDVRVRRLPERASYDRASIDAIVDAALVAHVGSVHEGRPVVVPMLCLRDRDWLVLHGSPGSGTARRARDLDVCVTMTVLDGLVLARSAFHHSLNYRSVVVMGRAEVVRDEHERARLLEAYMERLVPGRQARLRPSTTAEIRQTAVLRLSLEHASAKVRSGPPSDDEADYAWPVWAGVLPVTTRIGEPVADPRLAPGIEPADDVMDLVDRVL